MRHRALILMLSAVLAAPASAQGIMGDMHGDVTATQKKFIDLAKAIPASAYDWRPKGARSIRQVFLHIASDNYFLAIPMGKPAPDATHITATDFKALETFEKQKMTKAQIVAELETSFGHLHQAMAMTTEANINEKVKFFGQDMTRQAVTLATVTHMHEHLGQLVAYARSNNVTPPWSK